jgi:hypothetical protein
LVDEQIKFMPLYIYLQGGILSTAGQTPLVTQAAGLMQSSIAATQQPVPVFRPGGVHLSHYPPNYLPYGHYFSPFYVPPPAIHQFLGNGAFPQQPQASTVYPPPQAVAAPGMKFPLPQFKPGTNAANPTHLVMPNTFGVYGSSPAGYNHNSVATAGNSTSNEDLNSSQFKETNVYISGPQVCNGFPFDSSVFSLLIWLRILLTYLNGQRITTFKDSHVGVQLKLRLNKQQFI